MRIDGFVLVIGTLLVVIALLVYRFSEHIRQDQHARLKCLELGYPDIKKIYGRYFCTRRVNGTDQVLELQPERR